MDRARLAFQSGEFMSFSAAYALFSQLLVGRGPGANERNASFPKRWVALRL